jgi:hypothetical protein
MFHPLYLIRHLNPEFTQFCPGCFTGGAFGFRLCRRNPTVGEHEAEQSAVGYEPAFQFIAPDTPLRIGTDFDNALSCAAPDAQPPHCSGPVWWIVRIISNVLANSQICISGRFFGDIRLPRFFGTELKNDLRRLMSIAPRSCLSNPLPWDAYRNNERMVARGLDEQPFVMASLFASNLSFLIGHHPSGWFWSFLRDAPERRIRPRT